MGKNNNAYDKFSRNNFKSSVANNNRINNKINFPRYNQNMFHTNEEYQNQEDISSNEELTTTEEAVKTAGKAAATAYGGKLGGAAYDIVSNTEIGNKLIKQTTKKLKLYLYAGIGLAVLFLLLVIFMVGFIDNMMSNILNFTNWNFGSSSATENEVIDSDSNFSSNESETIKDNTLLSLIGEEGITKIENDINEVIINNCSGKNVATIVVKLIDGLNQYGYRVPKSDYDKIINQDRIINPNWGGKFTEIVNESEIEYTYGFNSFTFLAWTFTNSKINKIVSLNEIYNNESLISMTSVVPGDLIIKDDVALLVIQNVGTSITVAEVTNEGLKYSEYKNQELNDYVAVSMNNYYLNNCSV